MILAGARIFLPNSQVDKGWLEIEGTRIKALGTIESLPRTAEKKIDCQGLNLMPGLIDQHVHGGWGLSFLHAGPEEYRHLSLSMAREGVTSFLPATATAPGEELTESLVRLGRFCAEAEPGLPQPLGIHLEGPFLNPAYIGAQNPAHILRPSAEALSAFYEASGQSIRLITFAPELAGQDFFAFLRHNGIAASAGHSAATFGEIEEALPLGLSCLTHFHNAATPHHHRSPGVVTAGLFFNGLFTELIADGLHVHPDALRLTRKAKGAGRIILVTDAVACKGLPDGAHEIDGISVVKSEGSIRMRNGGGLAGSILSLNGAAANYCAFTGAPLAEALKAASENPARLLGLFRRKGSLAQGKDADLILTEDDFTVHGCYCRGKALTFL